MICRAILVAVLLAVPLTPVSAQGIVTKADCVSALTDARNARAESDSGPKANKQADDLLEVAEHLCNQGNFVYAGKVLAVVRSILATEN